MKTLWYEVASVLFLVVVLLQACVTLLGGLLPPSAAGLDLSPAYGVFLAALLLWLLLGRRRMEEGE